MHGRASGFPPTGVAGRTPRAPTHTPGCAATAPGNGCAAIPGAHGSAYIATPADIGHTIRLQVDARNAGGLTRAFSPPTAIVAARPSPAAAKPANTVRPSIAGTAQEGKTLTGNRGRGRTTRPASTTRGIAATGTATTATRSAPPGDDELHAEERRHRQDDPVPRARPQFVRLRQGELRPDGRRPRRRPAREHLAADDLGHARRGQRRSPAGTAAGRTGRPRTPTPGTAATATATTAPRSAAPARAPTG